jgi:DNA-binding SARP family transcriptional activator
MTPQQAQPEAGQDLDTDLWFGLLGPVEARTGGLPVDLGPRQRRVLLIRLLVENGRPVSMDQLCDDLWAGNPSTGAVSAVRAHISRLRSALEPAQTARGQGQLLMSGPGGYSLCVPDTARDTVRFERALEQTRRFLEAGRTAAARDEVDRALNSWRGRALADAQDHAYASEECWRLEELRHVALELRITVLMTQGDCGQAVTAAQHLTVQQPLRETAWVLLLRSLQMAGRAAEAVQQYNRVRRLLLAELGLEPGPALRQVRTDIQHHRMRPVSGQRSGG